jgi:hypothetical protein
VLSGEDDIEEVACRGATTRPSSDCQLIYHPSVPLPHGPSALSSHLRNIDNL